MNTTTKNLLRLILLLPFLLVLAAALAKADEPRRPRNLGEVPRIFTATCDMTLSAATGACTIQQPATGSADNIRLISAWVLCSVACKLQQERGGTAATATAVTIRDVNGKGSTTTAGVYSASNVGAGSVAVDPVDIQAGIETPFDFPNTVYLIGSGSTKNYTFRSNSITGRFKVLLLFEAYN